MQEILAALRAVPVIAAVRGAEQLAGALESRVGVVFLLGGDPASLPGRVRAALDAGKLAFVHMDLVEGFAHDAAGVRWLARAVRPTGVLSTRAPLLRAAFEPLRDASLLCANAFSWAEQAPLLSAHAREGLLRGGAALEDAGFY